MWLYLVIAPWLLSVVQYVVNRSAFWLVGSVGCAICLCIFSNTMYICFILQEAAEVSTWIVKVTHWFCPSSVSTLPTRVLYWPKFSGSLCCSSEDEDEPPSWISGHVTSCRHLGWRHIRSAILEIIFPVMWPEIQYGGPDMTSSKMATGSHVTGNPRWRPGLGLRGATQTLTILLASMSRVIYQLAFTNGASDTVCCL